MFLKVYSIEYGITIVYRLTANVNKTPILHVFFIFIINLDRVL